MPSDKETVCKILCSCKLPQMKIHDSLMWSIENSPEPTPELSSLCLEICYIWRRIYDKMLQFELFLATT